MADLIYASIFWALLAWAGHFLIGPIEGIALWRIFAITGVAGFVHGYLTSESRRRIRLRDGTELRAEQIETLREEWDSIMQPGIDADVDGAGRALKQISDEERAAKPELREIEP